MKQWACIKCIFGFCRHFVCTGNVKKNLPVTVHPLLYADCTFKIPSDECVGVILDIFFDSTAKTLVIYREFWYFSRIFPTLFS